MRSEPGSCPWCKELDYYPHESWCIVPRLERLEDEVAELRREQPQRDAEVDEALMGTEYGPVR